jgi:hypothetical protein
MLTKIAENAVYYFECTVEPCGAKNSCYTEKF